MLFKGTKEVRQNAQHCSRFPLQVNNRVSFFDGRVKAEGNSDSCPFGLDSNAP